MKIILFGGAEIGEEKTQFKLMEEILLRFNPKQIFHIPFARSKETEISLGGEDWFTKQINIGKAIYLNAANKSDIEKADNPLVFITGGGQNITLMEAIFSNPKILELVNKAEYLLAESAGAKILGTYFRSTGSDENSIMPKGLNIIKDSVIEPHYTQRKRENLLIKDMSDSRVKYGLGIDTCTAMEFDLSNFPDKYEKLGTGTLVIKFNN